MKSILLLFLIFPLLAFTQPKSPAEFLGYELGAKFTRHHQVVDYFSHLSESSQSVSLHKYGVTYEGRELLIAFVSTPENIEKLEKIRLDNLKRAGLVEGSPSSEIAIVWLSYNVHGNEASSTEASMATIYELVRVSSDKTKWLENTIVVIDPCINPDGRDRYVNFYYQNGSLPFNPDINALEHNEPWPGGRPNHYLFDLNRDWAWQTQIETKQRMKVYNQWLPQIHVDFHEQSHNSPYYFAPAARPYHELITEFQRDFQIEIGRNHASYFDQNDWFYFTKQWFDLLYPSYGDTYPTYNGAIGMTYEQAGHGKAGLGVLKQEGDTLTLKDRLTHHHTTGLSTIEISSKNSARLLQQFGHFFNNPKGLTYKSFVLKHDGNTDKFDALKDWLDEQGIVYGKGNSSKGLKGYQYSTGRVANFSLNANDLVISLDQPKAILAHILFEPKSILEDSATYDITAWGIPYAYGLEAYASEAFIPITASESSSFSPIASVEKAYAFVNKWNSLEDAQFLAALLKEGIKVRFTQKSIRSNRSTFGRGSIIIAKRDNRLVSDFEGKIIDLANKYERNITVLNTGFMDSGPDIGSADVRYLKKPSVALIGYEGVSSLSFGAHWHFMEQELEYPVSIIGADYLGQVDLEEYQVLIMPDGSYHNFGDSEMKKITSWVENGGKLIAIKGALGKLKDSEYSQLASYKDDSDKKKAEELVKQRQELARLVPYEEKERDFLKGYIPGAIYKVKVDNTHPLAFGYGKNYYVLKNSTAKVAYLNGNNVGIIPSKDNLISGFSGVYANIDVANSLAFGVEYKGKGQIIYFVDDPMFRSFWQNGKLLMVNAIFYVGQ